MKIGIIVAMSKELRLLLNELTDKTDVTVDNVVFHVGRIGTHIVYAMQCGIGKVNAAIGTQLLINKFSPDLVINTGVAGGACQDAKQMDVVIGAKIAYHDVWCGPGTEYGEAAGCPLYFASDKTVIKAAEHLHLSEPLKFGLICSGDKFIASKEEIQAIKKHFPDVTAVDMESASIAQVCYLKNKPFFILRVISDNPDTESDNSSQYEDFWETAPAKTFQVLTNILTELK